MTALPVCQLYEVNINIINILIADINPIGGISKTDLKKFIAYAQDAFDLPILERSALTYHRVPGTDLVSVAF